MEQREGNNNEVHLQRMRRFPAFGFLGFPLTTESPSFFLRFRYGADSEDPGHLGRHWVQGEGEGAGDEAPSTPRTAQTDWKPCGGTHQESYSVSHLRLRAEG